MFGLFESSNPGLSRRKIMNFAIFKQYIPLEKKGSKGKWAKELKEGLVYVSTTKGFPGARRAVFLVAFGLWTKLLL